jgi:O-antigen/teichoic acid export membrane protein
MTDFRDRTIVGISWSVASQIGQHGTLAVTTIILANLLSPREFGLLAMITIITRFAEILTELGFGAALVQRKEIRPIHLTSVFWVNLATGAVITGSLMLSAPLVGDFYGEPRLVPLTIFVALTFFVSSAGIVPRTLFTRDIDFRTIAIVETSAAIIGGISAIVMALCGPGVCALVVDAARKNGHEWTPIDVINAVEATAEEVHETYTPWNVGAGFVNAAAAVRRAERGEFADFDEVDLADTSNP